MARIAVVGKYYPPFEGGIEVNTRDVCEFLSRTHDVTAIVHAHAGAAPGTETIDGVRVRRCRTLGVIQGQPVSLSLILDVLRAPADIVHLHAPNFLAALALAARFWLLRSRAELVVTHHADVHGRRFLRALALPAYRLLLRRASAVIVTSLKNAAISRDLLPGARVVSVPLGIDPADFRLGDGEIADAMAWRRSVAGSAPTVCFVGRHARYKGLDVLVRALADLPDVHALIAGDGPYRSAAERLARELNVQDRTHFLGQVDHRTKLRILACSDVFAFPSTEITEAFGVSQLEAMAMKVPVVATDLPTGVTDVAVHGETAYVVPPGDAAAFAGGLRRLLADRVLAGRLADGAWTALLARYRRDTTVARTAGVIERTLAGEETHAAVVGTA